MRDIERESDRERRGGGRERHTPGKVDIGKGRET